MFEQRSRPDEPHALQIPSASEHLYSRDLILMTTKRPFTVAEILRWADAFHTRHGRWPSVESGRITECPTETWRRVGRALEVGLRGLPGGATLPRLLQTHRGHRHLLHLPPLTIQQILMWADTHRERTGQWPVVTTGPILDAPDESWIQINTALIFGRRGLPRGLSLAKVLSQHRGRPNPQQLPKLTRRMILSWADAHHARTGLWPNVKSGPVSESPEDTWRGIHSALSAGARGLPGGSTLPRLLAMHRGVRNRARLGRSADRNHTRKRPSPAERPLRRPQLTIPQILSWADQHQRRTGRWPVCSDGHVTGAPTESWNAINVALSQGLRGLPGGSSLVRLLAERRGARNRMDMPPLTIRLILAWADAHRRRHKEWPQYHSGPIAAMPGETWGSVNTALVRGTRGLRRGSSLARLLAEQRGVRNRWSLGRLTPKTILAWADAHRQRTGRWPRRTDGPVKDAPGETWSGINSALLEGLRGLPGGQTLIQLLARRR